MCRDTTTNGISRIHSAASHVLKLCVELEVKVRLGLGHLQTESLSDTAAWNERSVSVASGAQGVRHRVYRLQFVQFL